MTEINAQNGKIISKLEVYTIANGERKEIYRENTLFEAPNWSHDGTYFIINENGLLYKIGLKGKTKKLIPTDFADRCNNDHGISPDGQTLVISNNDRIEGASSGSSRIYTLPIEGGVPSLVTPKYPSYWHGWSPDGKDLVYTAKRDGDFDIYKIAVTGGKEIRLTSVKGLDDGPEYSPYGNYIYYNSMQSGKMEIWRMKADGSEKEQITNDSYSNWFPHPSPKGDLLVYLSYLEDQGDRHPAMKSVALRLLDLKSNKPHYVVHLYRWPG